MDTLGLWGAWGPSCPPGCWIPEASLLVGVCVSVSPQISPAPNFCPPPKTRKLGGEVALSTPHFGSLPGFPVSGHRIPVTPWNSALFEKKDVQTSCCLLCCLIQWL